MDKIDCVVIGAGVIGLSTARSLALAGREVVVLETEKFIASHTSSRNSEVIHAGIYYPENSLKARLCVAGKELLYRYCEDYAIPFRRSGKLIVATERDEIPVLQRYLRQSRLNGVEDLELLSAREVSTREPLVRCIAGLWSPSTGILDSHAYLLALQAQLESAGGSIICRSRVRSIKFENRHLSVSVESDPVYQVRCNFVINSTGLWARQLVAHMDGFPSEKVPNTYLSKGHYYAYRGRSLFGSLVYPVASGAGLGIHATNDLAGGIRFGPDAQWIDTIDYEFDDGRKNDFVTAIQKYYPGINPDKLQPAFTGIRPKLRGPGKPAADFLIQGEADHGIKGLVNLFGIESPGLTASLAIGEYVKNKLLTT